MYARLLVHATLNLAYPKEHIYYMPSIYSIILSFWNLLHSSVICNCVIMTCDRFFNTVSGCVTVCDSHTKP